MALIRTLEILASFSTPVIVAFALAATGLLFIIHKVLSDRLSHVPDPFIARLTPYWIDWHTFVGDECTVIDHLHKQYGSIVRKLGFMGSLLYRRFLGFVVGLRE